MIMKTFVKNSLTRVLSTVFYPFYKRPVLNKVTLSETDRELISGFHQLELLDTDTPFGSKNEWHRNLNELKKNIIANGGRKFLKFNVVQRTMLITYADYTRKELKALRSRLDWNRWKKVLRESVVGLPTPYLLWPMSSSNLIHHVYHVSQWEDRAQKLVTDVPVVVEFGGGYGSMCRLFHELGFHGLYVIYDFPHFSKIQTYFLKSQGYKCLTLSEACTGKKGFVCLSSVDELEKLFSTLKVHDVDSLFVATWSLSESPLDVRKSMEKYIRLLRYHLVAYQKKFNEMDNHDYFESLYSPERYKRSSEEIDFLKTHFYFFAEKSD